MTIAGIPTPALLLERRVLERNIEAMAGRARRLSVALRPHFKTHKCVEVARLQAAHGVAGFTVSTLVEAEALRAAGFEDLIWAVPLAPPKIPAALEAAARGPLRLLVDDLETLTCLESAAAASGLRPHVWLKVDCGYHRAGVDPDSPAALELARRLSASRVLVFDGLLTHAGHAYSAYDPGQRRRIAIQERQSVVDLARRLLAEGVHVPSLSIGSTPTLTAVDHLEGIDEIRPGNYVYFDLTQVALGSCDLPDVALSILATVISHPAGGERAVVDAGALALSKDPGPPAGGPGAGPGLGGVCLDVTRPVPDPGLRLASLSQEHGVIRPGHGGGLEGRLPVGAQVRILPNHSCLASACFDELYLVEDGRVLDRWPIQRRR